MPVRPALAVVLLALVTACGGTPPSSAPDPAPSTVPSTVSTTAPTSAPSASPTGAPAEGVRTIEFRARDYGFPGLPGFTARVGEKVRFAMANISDERQHDFQLFLPDGKELGVMDLVGPGERGEIVLTLPVPGTYRFVCGVGNHEEQGQKGTFDVSP